MARVVDLWHNRDRTRTSRYGTGQRWQAVWFEDGKPRKKSCPTKAAAEEHLVWVTHQQKTGAYVSADRGRVFVRDLLDAWMDAQVHLRASTAAAMRSDVRATILPYWGDRVLADITKDDVQRWVAGMGKAARTVDTIHGRLNNFLSWCVDQQRITVNPARGVNLPRGAKREHQFLTVAQVRALAEAIDGRYADLVWLLATTGMRMGEACELRWKDVDLRRRRLTVARAVVFVQGRPVVGPPKSGKPRTIPLTTMAASVLAERRGTAGGDELVFTTSRGMQVRANNFKRRHFDDAVARVNGVPDGARVPAGLWVHDLRHTAASWAVQSGASVKSVQRMLGHATAAMTLDVYAGLFDQDLDDVAVRLDALLAA
ncbi:tyrosine-type recombinase/integrase [Arthrobacter sp. N1]|uniref:tyrosine-type recombinase/integrase n=1 Tax=Arthrobacter sp. N1 TaxID=619291 RepID=UPI003BAE75E1